MVVSGGAFSNRKAGDVLANSLTLDVQRHTLVLIGFVLSIVASQLEGDI